MQGAQLFDVVEILRNLHCRCHILGLVWVSFVLLDADGNHHVQCLSQSAIYRSAASPQSSSSPPTSTTTMLTSNMVPLSRDGRIATASLYDVRFGDVFWNGAEGDDESLTFSMKSNARLAAGRETFVKTATVVATVYVDGNSDEDGDDCNSIDCHGDGDIDDNSLAFDKRFWLITRVGGALTEDELPNFKRRLAELYRKAFTRQQSIHLGIITPALNTTTTELPVITMTSGELELNGSSLSNIQPTSVQKYESMVHNRTDTHRNHSTIIILPSINLTTIFNTEHHIQPPQLRSMVHNKKVVPSIRPTPVALAQTQTTVKLNDFQHLAIKRSAHDSLNHLKYEHRKRVEVTVSISIIIHNVSVAVDDFNDAENRNEWPVKNGTRNGTTTTTTATTSNPLNQTEIIYSVLVNGHAVLAIIAAGDMELMTDAEAINELDKVVYMKAEPYLKEPPYATPLIPSAAPTIELATILGQFLHAPNLLILIGIVGFLLTCLLMALMLLSVGSRRSQRGKSKNLVSREVQTSHTVSPVQSARFERGVRSIDEYAANTTATIAAPPITGPRVHTANQVAAQMTSLHGFDNFGFERDHSFILIPPPPSKSSKHPTHNKKVGTPNIYFPNPPSAASTSAAQSSADSLSDASSIYYIKKPPKRERDRDRDRLTDSSRTRGRVYATILRKPSNRKPIANHVKQKRKYLKSENRVGTLVETAQVHSSHSDITHIDGNSDTFDEDKDANVYEHIEAINPFAGNYANQRKRQFDEKTKSAERVNVTGQRDDDAPNVQYNNHFLGKSQRENDRRSRTTDAELKSSAAVKNAGVLDKKSTKQRQSPHETGDNDDAISVGSFLSMASVRSFPKCVVPEPLTRVLNCDDDIETAEAINRVPRIVDTKLKNDGWTAPRPPKSVDDGKFVHLTRTRSDGADPGVIGPIVWQIHKQQQEANDSLSPLRDPAFERNRYEGLLEGAMNLYTIETTETHSIETATTDTATATMRAETQRTAIYASKVISEK